MATVTHILKNGRIVTDISGHIVTKEDVRGVYDLMENINRKGGKRTQKNADDENIRHKAKLA